MAEDPGQENRDAPGNENKLLRGRLIGLALAGAILAIVILLVWVKPSDPTEKKDFIQAVGVLLAALAGLGGLYFTRENTEKQLRQARESQDQTQRLTERGQITDRFTRAIDQLGKTDDAGNKLFEIRLGGIYALERIARESEEDHWPIMEVLTAYVRQHAHRAAEEAQEGTDNVALEMKSKEDLVWKEVLDRVPPPPPDIQAIMTVLRRRTRSYGHGEPEPLDLHETNLRGANLRGANLRGANLLGTDLRGAHLSEADLSATNLTGGVDLSDADLWDANLSEANLWDADLTEAHLVRANLWDANLWDTNLTETHFYRTNLSQADLTGAKNLTRAQIKDALLNERTKLPSFVEED